MALRLPRAVRRDAYLGGFVRDIGKLVASHRLLRHPGPLTPAERQLMELHTLAGASMVRSLPGLQALAPVVLHHHERWDGCGYPDGLVRAAAPQAARIVGVADAYAALTTERPYRRALVAGDALDLVASLRGRQFDPAVVDVLLALAAGDLLEPGQVA